MGLRHNTDELIARLLVVGDRLADELPDAVERSAALMATTAQRNASGRPGPNVRTGHLRRSIRWSRRTKTRYKTVVDVGTNTVYARRLEHGFTGTDGAGRHYNQRPYPFLQPAVEEVRPFFEAEIAAAIERAAR